MYTAQNYCLLLCIACVCVCVDGLHREESLLYSDRVRPLEWNAWWDSVMSSKSLNKHGWFQLVLCVCVCVCDHQPWLYCVHWSFLLKPSWMFFLLKYSDFFSRCSPPAASCRLLSFIFHSRRNQRWHQVIIYKS